MDAHQRIDLWSLAMMREIVARIDADPSRAGLQRARAIAWRWEPKAAVVEWRGLLEKSWEELRPILLDESDEGQRLRSSAPFCGILTPRERADLWRRFRAS